MRKEHKDFIKKVENYFKSKSIPKDYLTAKKICGAFDKLDILLSEENCPKQK